MKLFIASLFVIAFTGCTVRNQYGPCIGINDKENPKYEYKYSTTNIIMAALFIESIVVPAVVIFDDLKCPIGPR
jgi:hypothetical protein